MIRGRADNYGPVSIRLEMLQVARLAPKLLGDATDLVRGFLQSQQNQDGGFRDRTGQSDLYYTVFGLNSFPALGDDFEGLRYDPGTFVRSFGRGEELDVVHLCCLARAWAALSREKFPTADVDALLGHIEKFRSGDGGYANESGRPFGSVYGCFLAWGAYQDLGRSMPNALGVVQCLKLLETKEGAWVNDRLVRVGSVPATAAAVTLLRQLGMPVNESVGQWLLERAHAQGGFCAVPGAPVPDLLSTATALHALAGLQVPFKPIQESCLDFIDSLWTNEGAFHGHWEDDILDCEYTFYGLLALGHLSL